MILEASPGCGGCGNPVVVGGGRRNATGRPREAMRRKLQTHREDGILDHIWAKQSALLSGHTGTTPASLRHGVVEVVSSTHRCSCHGRRRRRPSSARRPLSPWEPLGRCVWYVDGGWDLFFVVSGQTCCEKARRGRGLLLSGRWTGGKQRARGGVGVPYILRTGQL